MRFETSVTRLQQLVFSREESCYNYITSKTVCFSQDGNVLHLYLNMESNSQCCVLSWSRTILDINYIPHIFCETCKQTNATRTQWRLLFTFNTTKSTQNPFVSHLQLKQDHLWCPRHQLGSLYLNRQMFYKKMISLRLMCINWLHCELLFCYSIMLTTLKPLFQSSQKLVRSSLRVLASN